MDNTNKLTKLCTELYLDYVNNFLTIEKWQEYYNLSNMQVAFILQNQQYNKKDELNSRREGR